MRIGVFGGTFDPPHLGHQILAAEAVQQSDLDRLLWVLTPTPPHKLQQQHTVLEHRLEMVRRMVALHPKFELSEVEIRRPGPHYALDTMLLLQEQYPTDVLCYLIGGDSLRDLHLWHKPEAFMNACDEIVVMRRAGAKLGWRTISSQFPVLKKKVKFLDAPLIEISASRIREKAGQGETVWQYLTPEVNAYIQENRLYQ